MRTTSIQVLARDAHMCGFSCFAQLVAKERRRIVELEERLMASEAAARASEVARNRLLRQQEKVRWRASSAYPLPCFQSHSAHIGQDCHERKALQLGNCVAPALELIMFNML